MEMEVPGMERNNDLMKLIKLCQKIIKGMTEPKATMFVFAGNDL
jgi:hypothetical protein